MQPSYRSSLNEKFRFNIIGHFTVMDGSEAGVDLVLITNLPALLCKSSYSYAN